MRITALIALLFCNVALASDVQWGTPDWSIRQTLPASGERSNIYNLSEEDRRLCEMAKLIVRRFYEAPDAVALG